MCHKYTPRRDGHAVTQSSRFKMPGQPAATFWAFAIVVGVSVFGTLTLTSLMVLAHATSWLDPVALLLSVVGLVLAIVLPRVLQRLELGTFIFVAILALVAALPVWGSLSVVAGILTRVAASPPGAAPAVVTANRTDANWPLPICGSDSPWTITEMLDEGLRPVLDRCSELRRELLRKAQRSCTTAADCVATSGCVAIARGDGQVAPDFERAWAAIGCPAKEHCRKATPVCRERQCDD